VLPDNWCMGNRESRRFFRPQVYYGWYVLAVCWIATFLLNATAVSIFFKPILDEFNLDRTTLSLVSSVTMLVFAVIYPFMGRLIDLFGARIMIGVGIIGQTVSAVINGTASGLAALYAGRLIYEVRPTHSSLVIINNWFVKKRGRALGILSTSGPLGALVLSPLSQMLITAWGWRQTMFFWGGISAIMLIPVLLILRNKPSDRGLTADGGSSPTNNPREIPSEAYKERIAAQSKISAGYDFGQVIKIPAFWQLTLTQLFCGISCGLLGTHLVIFATDMGYSALIGATFLSLQGGMSVVGVLVTGPLSDRWPRNKVLAITHLVRGLSFVVLVITIVFSHGSLVLLYLAMALFGLGWFTTAPLSAGLAADLFGNLRLGTILGIVLAGHIIGSSIGTYAGGLSYQLTGSYLDIFISCAVFESVAVILAYFIRGRKTDAYNVGRPVKMSR
jgi:MFS family permease